MKIRLAQIADAPALAAVERTQPRAAAWAENGFKTELAQPCACIWCAEEAGEIIGFIAARVAADTAEILNVAVRADYTHRAVGRALLNEMLADLKRRGAREVSLEVAQDNAAACALYKQAGFAAVNVRKDFYGPRADGWIMRKDL